MNPEAMKRMLKKHKQMKKIRDKTRHQTVNINPKTVVFHVCVDENPFFYLSKNMLRKAVILKILLFKY